MIKLNIQKKIRSANTVFDMGVCMEVSQCEFVTVFGRSGSGKTTLLKIIAGLVRADSGFIKLGDLEWFNSQNKKDIPPQKRGIGFVFQDYALFPNMTVKGNIEYACSKNDKDLADKLLSVTGLTSHKHCYPDTLSGGQKQRVALARALACKPKLLLLDEPLSALDSEMRVEMQDFLQDIHEQFKTTTIMVSHDIEEVYKLSDRVFLLEHGKIVKTGKPEEVFCFQSKK